MTLPTLDGSCDSRTIKALSRTIRTMYLRARTKSAAASITTRPRPLGTRMETGHAPKNVTVVRPLVVSTSSIIGMHPLPTGSSINT